MERHIYLTFNQIIFKAAVITYSKHNLVDTSTLSFDPNPLIKQNELALFTQQLKARRIQVTKSHFTPRKSRNLQVNYLKNIKIISKITNHIPQKHKYDF